jgi:DNA-directed RNA polymerase subunit E'/Rpb7
MMKQRNKDAKLSTIYSRCLITRNVVLPITSIGTNIREIINKKINDNYEGKCLVEGFIEKNSTKIVSHSSGLIQRGTNITFVVVFECNVCFPVEGTLISCIAKNITKAGIRAESSDEIPSPIVVFIARDHHYNSEQFNEIKEGDKFTARVIGQRFELNDKYVSIIAELKVERKIERKPIGSKKAKGVLLINDVVLSEDSESDEN